MAKLTARRVQSEARPGTYGDGGGLYLQVATGGSKSWIYRYQVDGRRRSLGLGGLTTVSLAQARDKAADARKLLAAGRDPIEARNSRAAPRVKAMTFEQCANAYIAAHRPAGGTLGMPANGRPALAPMPIRSSATCRSPRSTSRPSCR